MKRDIDLARQLLLDIEARGADCSVSVLRTAADHDAEERVRYHLRLLIDAGYLKEIDRTANGVPCLRLTDSGHELIELTRSEARWRRAKWACHERTGGLALAVVRGILLEWALAPQRQVRRPARRYRPAVAEQLLVERPYRPYVAPPYVAPPVDEVDHYPGYELGYEPAYEYEGYEPTPREWDFTADEQVRYVRVRPKHRNGWRPRTRPLNGRLPVEANGEPSLPEYLI